MSSPGKVVRFPSERTRPGRLLTLAELREQFGYSTRWWRYRIADGLPCHRWGGGLRFDPLEVAYWLDAQYRRGKTSGPRDEQTSGGLAKPD